jgi:N-acetylglucosaminylphosphatidylinositol deacetylase
MFFGPIIRLLSSSKLNNKIFVLCMTSGNYYGLGETRKNELMLSCRNLVVDNESVKVELIDDNQNLPDNPIKKWDKQLCHSVIEKFVQSNKIDVLITFDKHGVSSHLNHCFLNQCILDMLKSNNFSSFTTLKHVYFLKTVNVIRKYLFIFDLVPTLFLNSLFDLFNLNNTFSPSILAVNTLTDYSICFNSMLKHESQLTWFRYLYIISSRYMFINDLDKIL